MNLHDDTSKVFERRREPSYGSTAARYNSLAKLGERVLEILALNELPAGFDAPDKIVAIRKEAERLGLAQKGGR